MEKKPTYEELEQEIGQLRRKESDYKKTRELLEENITRYRTLFESANDAIMLVKKNAFVECNKKALEMFGCEKEDIIGRSFYDFSPEKQPDGSLSKSKGTAKRRLAEQGYRQIFEWVHKRKDGTLFDAEVSHNRIKLGGEVFVQAIVRDITERKQAEERLLKAFSEIKRLKKRLEDDYMYLQEEVNLTHNFKEIIGESDKLRYSLLKVEQIAPTDTTVLILGETGVGKELFARAIHHASRRKGRPLVKVNCASLPLNLIESELFGHEKGAFTGAHSKQLGRFEIADGTTIFLDEVGELPLELQAKLLRVLQDGEFERLGNSRTIRTDVRIIAATNRDLKEEVRRERFRKDLWYRLNVFPITIPPLRERKEDIPLLVNWLVKKLVKKLGKEIEKIPQKTMLALQSYDWPGNVRELENVIERAVINTKDSTLYLADKLECGEVEESAAKKPSNLSAVERDHILQMLKGTKWKVSGKTGAAALLGLNPSTLRGRMRKLGIRRPWDESN